MTEGDAPKRDSQRSKVYAAEEFVRTMFDRAAEYGSSAVEFFGTQLTLPPEGRFGSVASVQRYVDEVLALPAVRDRWPEVSPLRVRSRRAATAAHYENHDGAGIIAVPDRNTADWALRELVVLHEVAHHLCHAQPAHGPEFVDTICSLAELVMGPELGHVLRVVYAKEGVHWTATMRPAGRAVEEPDN
ncbi:TIGR04338 family metallohydrolase [Mycobacterium sp. Aquia_213]|uniref:TIGR04338 family metallohydrolase n=1 Tax=Mycobacterium sp. Aquia_213 TaxID=2991728 RepID=UPI00226E27E4|nr:TIGR04338 family metallohydrolase [Mycobacterium sp. Aquia_213]WAC91314.1 TIGR04338 family metallohydrolase [Mycobacterium sp. Aquia_213]